MWLATTGGWSRQSLSSPPLLAPPGLSAVAPAPRTADILQSGFPPARGQFHRARPQHRSSIARWIDAWLQPHLGLAGLPATRVAMLPGWWPGATSHNRPGRLRDDRPARAVPALPANAGHSSQEVV